LHKTTLAIGLLLSLSLPVLGGYAWLLYQKAAVRKGVEVEKKRGFAAEELVLLRFSRAEQAALLHWEHSTEFEYLGQMYDVIRSEAHPDSMYYWCYWDQEETRINQQLAKLQQGHRTDMPRQQQQEERLQYFFKSLCLPSQLRIVPPQPDQKQLVFYLLAHPKAVFFQPPTPPPRTVA